MNGHSANQHRLLWLSLGVVLCLFSLLFICAPAQQISSQTPMPNKRIVIAVSSESSDQRFGAKVIRDIRFRVG